MKNNIKIHLILASMFYLLFCNHSNISSFENKQSDQTMMGITIKTYSISIFEKENIVDREQTVFHITDDYIRSIKIGELDYKLYDNKNKCNYKIFPEKKKYIKYCLDFYGKDILQDKILINKIEVEDTAKTEKMGDFLCRKVILRGTCDKNDEEVDHFKTEFYFADIEVPQSYKNMLLNEFYTSYYVKDREMYEELAGVFSRYGIALKSTSKTYGLNQEPVYTAEEKVLIISKSKISNTLMKFPDGYKEVESVLSIALEE